MRFQLSDSEWHVIDRKQFKYWMFRPQPRHGASFDLNKIVEAQHSSRRRTHALAVTQLSA